MTFAKGDFVRFTDKAIKKYTNFLQISGINIDCYNMKNHKSETYTDYREDIIEKLQKCFLTVSNFV